MALATPTPAIRLAAAPNVVNRLYSFTPLTTAWTAPASCATAIPTIYAGTCNTASCSAYDATDVPAYLETNGAYVNYPQYTANGVMTSTACMPPGYQALESFFFTPATACPTNFITATSSSYNRQQTIACCPSYAISLCPVTVSPKFLSFPRLASHYLDRRC